MADATLKLLRDLDDPRLYHKAEAVPVFVPHKLHKRTPDGQLVEVEVTDADLKQIARHNNGRERQTGTLAVITLGHRKQSPDVSEIDQPPVVGFARNWRVGRFGPGQVRCLLCDEYVRQDRKDQVSDYPFRSADYYRGRMEISGVAKLKRDPELDLGMVVYGQAGEAMLCYSREVNMPDPTMPPDADAPMDTPVDAPAPMDDGAEREAYDRHCASSPYARKHYEKMLSYAGEGMGAPAMPGPTNGLPAPMPAPAPMAGEGAEQFQRRLQASQYQRRLEQAEAKAQAAEQKINLLTYERDLTQLVALGYEFDLAAELKDCETMAPEQFSRHKARIERIAARSPVGDPAPVRIAPTTGPGKAVFGERDLEACARYMREHPGVQLAEAREKVGQSA